MANREYTFDEEVVLVHVDPDSGEETRSVSYAEIRSVFASESYAAMAVGLRPEFQAILPSWENDYHGEHRLEYNGIPYRIIRAYHADDDMAELTVTRLKNPVPESDTLL